MELTLPETQVVRKFMQQQVALGKKFYFAIDFHSTFHDIYYTVAPELLYCKAVCLSKLNLKKEALEVLDEALVDNFSLHQSLFELNPQLRFDKDILAIINYYKGEVE